MSSEELLKYVSDFKLDLLYQVYNEEYVKSINPSNFNLVYNVFLKYGFRFIDDIIIHYLDLFNEEATLVEENLLKLILRLGGNYINKISRNLTLLEEIKA